MPSAEDEPSSPRGDKNGRGPEAPPMPPDPLSDSDGGDGDFHIDSGVGVGMSIPPGVGMTPEQQQRRGDGNSIPPSSQHPNSVGMSIPRGDENYDFDSGVGVGMAAEQQQRRGDGNSIPPSSQQPNGEGERGGESEGAENEEGRGRESGTESEREGTFNDNRPSSSANEQQRRPRPTSERSYTRQQMETIQDYRDVEETGKWGAISKREIIAVSVVLLLVIIGTIVAVVLATRGGDDEVKPTSAPTSPPTSPPSSPPTSTLAPSPLPSTTPSFAPSTFDSRASKGLTKLKTIDYGNQLPNDHALLEGKHDDASETPQVRAASWSLFVDRGTAVDSIAFVERYVLAVLYYSAGGTDWTDTTLWLNATASECEWHGVACEKANRDADATIVELDLGKNNVTGTNPLPFELTELKSLKMLNLKQNNLKGTIQGNIFEAMHDHLLFLYLEFNELEGSLPLFIKETSVLDIFSLQGNSISGFVNGTWCTHFEEGCYDRCLRKFSLDCEDVDCDCCENSDGVECF